MQVIPAIDLRGGRCVRLRQGDFDQETVFGDDPAAMAARWESEGAARIHLVDLDGAKAGRPVNVEAVRQIVDRVGVPCQLGGGIRDEATIAAWLEAGIERVVVGTQALRDPDWFGRMAKAYPGRLLLGLDARDGRVATQGWLETLERQRPDAGPAVRRAADRRHHLHRHRARRHARGPNLEAIAALAEAVRTPVIASGGVGTLEDLERLATLPIAGCIVGRALYDGRSRLAGAQQAVGSRQSAAILRFRPTSITRSARCARSRCRVSSSRCLLATL